MAVNENTELIDALNVSRAPHREAAQRYSDGVVRASNAPARESFEKLAAFERRHDQ